MANADQTQNAGVQGSSPLYRIGTTPNTRSVVSQKVRILAPSYGQSGSALLQIGVLSTFTPTESRTVEPVRGVGFGDQVAELVPGVTEPMTASIERQLLYLSNIWQATGYASGVMGPVRSLKHHRWPFDIRQEIVFSSIADADHSGSPDSVTAGAGFTGGLQVAEQSSGAAHGGDKTEGAHNILITYYETCWWTSWSNSGFSRDAALITESGDVTITDVLDGGTFEYGEFMGSGNDPTVDQVHSIRYDGYSIGGAT